MKARFITIEGGEGAGKSTAISAIEKCLKSKGIQYILTREPGGTDLGSKIRSLLLDPSNGAVSAEAELLMMQAARSQHVSEVIKPNLKKNVWVICDRYVDSTYAYQGARGLSMEALDATTKIATGGLMPDVTFFFDVDTEIGMERARQRAALDRIESEGMSFHETVSAIFRERSEAFPARIQVVDANRELDKVSNDIYSRIEVFVEDCLNDSEPTLEME